LLCFDDVQLLLQLANFCFLPLDFFGRIGLLLHYQKPLFSFSQFVGLMQLGQVVLACCFGRSRTDSALAGWNLDLAPPPPE
jgi:hypothetical protein